MNNVTLFPGSKPQLDDSIDESRVEMLRALDEIRERVQNGSVRAFVYAELTENGDAAYLPGVGTAGTLELRGLVSFLGDFLSVTEG